mgnify:CR=1 FL=1
MSETAAAKPSKVKSSFRFRWSTTLSRSLSKTAGSIAWLTRLAWLSGRLGWIFSPAAALAFFTLAVAALLGVVLLLTVAGGLDRGTRVLIGQPELRERLQHRTYRALTQRIGAQFLIVTDGLVSVRREEGDGSSELAVVAPVGLLGELSLLYNQPCWATATSVTETTVFAASQQEFFALLDDVLPELD